MEKTNLKKCDLPFKLDINLKDSKYHVANTQQEADEWIVKQKRENPTQEYMEMKYYVSVLVPISTEDAP